MCQGYGAFLCIGHRARRGLFRAGPLQESMHGQGAVEHPRRARGEHVAARLAPLALNFDAAAVFLRRAVVLADVLEQA